MMRSRVAGASVRRHRGWPRVSGVVAAGIVLLFAPAMRAGSVGVVGSVAVSGGVTNDPCGYSGSYSDTVYAPGDGPLSFSGTASGAVSGYVTCNPNPTGAAGSAASASGTLNGNQMSLSSSVDMSGGAAAGGGATGGLTSYDKITFQPGTYELTEFVTTAFDFSSADLNETIAAQAYVGGLDTGASTPYEVWQPGSTAGTYEFQTIFNVDAYYNVGTFSIYGLDEIDVYPGNSASGSVSITAYLDALSGSYVSASGTNYSTPTGTPEPATRATLMTGLLAIVVLTRQRRCRL